MGTIEVTSTNKPQLNKYMQTFVNTYANELTEALNIIHNEEGSHQYKQEYKQLLKQLTEASGKEWLKPWAIALMYLGANALGIDEAVKELNS